MKDEVYDEGYILCHLADLTVSLRVLPNDINQLFIDFFFIAAKGRNSLLTCGSLSFILRQTLSCIGSLIDLVFSTEFVGISSSWKG